MAKLTLTEEEREAESYLDWSDETLGKMVRTLAHKMINGDVGDSDTRPITMTAALVIIAYTAEQANADTYTQTLKEVTHGGHQLGDWRISAEKIK